MEVRKRNWSISLWHFLFIICAFVCIARPIYAQEAGAMAGIPEDSGYDDVDPQPGQEQEIDWGQEKVSGFTADKQTTDSIRFRWNALEGASGYTIYVYQEKNKRWKTLTRLPETSYVATGLTPATKYKYRIAAYRDDENGETIYSPLSKTLTTATVPGRSAIRIVQAGLFVGNIDFRLIILHAKKVKGASGYQFAYSRFKNKRYTELDPGKLVGRLKIRRGKVYYFKVRAYKRVGKNYYFGAYSEPKAERIRR